MSNSFPGYSDAAVLGFVGSVMDSMLNLHGNSVVILTIIPTPIFTGNYDIWILLFELDFSTYFYLYKGYDL